MAAKNTGYENFILSNEIEDQYTSHLDNQNFVTVDNSLVGEAGFKKKINKYSATSGAQKLAVSEGNTKKRLWLILWFRSQAQRWPELTFSIP